ncbi:MAG TPA: DDE-type integrase/transposase/recombinase [Dongiaceae bacterium]|nr:DDE-type integrase/transposase/recombinase [Dongiaceae bacterium]
MHRRRATAAPRQARTRPVELRGRRFTPEQHAEALRLIAGGMQRAAVAKHIGATTESLRRWYAVAKAAGTLPASPAPTASAKSRAQVRAAAPPPTPTSSAPKDPGAGLGEHEVQTILGYKKKHPSMGPAQIRAQLKRFLGWRLSVRAIARVLRSAGFAPVHRGGRPVGDEHPQRFEAPHRGALWQLDFTELRVGAERRYLLVIEDDFSRFVVGHQLAEGPSGEAAVAVMREAIRLHGKPERVYTDRGGAFTAWRDLAGFEVFCDEQLIDHSLRRAHRPQGGGKIEAVMATVQRELWQVVHFESVGDAERALAEFFADYNHRRAHLGIGGLVPADRFFGRWSEVAAQMDALSRGRQGALALAGDRRLSVEPPAPGERAVCLQLVIAGDVAELHFLGRRIRLGHVEA